VSQKKQDTLLMSINMLNINRFSQFCHRQLLLQVTGLA